MMCLFQQRHFLRLFLVASGKLIVADNPYRGFSFQQQALPHDILRTFDAHFIEIYSR